MKRRPESVFRRFRQVDPRDIGISIITIAELEYGAAKSQAPQRNRDRFKQFCQPFPVLGLSDGDVRVFGEIRADLERRGLTLITNNVREFERVPQLKVENWVDG